MEEARAVSSNRLFIPTLGRQGHLCGGTWRSACKTNMDENQELGSGKKKLEDLDAGPYIQLDDRPIETQRHPVVSQLDFSSSHAFPILQIRISQFPVLGSFRMIMQLLSYRKQGRYLRTNTLGRRSSLSLSSFINHAARAEV